MSIKGVHLVLSQQSKRMLNEQPKQFRKGTASGVKSAMQNLESDARKNFSGANQLKTRSGYLRRSISYGVYEAGDMYVGTIGSDAIYAAIHEFGGVITASAKQYLTFKGQNGWVKVKSVTIPPRPFLANSIERNKKRMSREIVDYINRSLKL